jgi:hypothetical protein
VGLVVALLLASVVLIAGALVIGSLSRLMREALGDEGIAIVFYGFTLITLVAVIRMLTPRDR